MITTIITALIANYLTTTFVIGLVIAAIRVLAHRGPRTASYISGTFLNSFVIWAIGVGQILNGIMHSVFGDYAAHSIGWAQSPFQLELGMCSLGLGVMAFILGRRTSPLIGKAALVIGVSIFGYGASVGHFYQMFAHHDFAVNNTGLLLISDLVINTVGLVLVIWHAIAQRRHADPTDGRVVVANEPAHV